MTYTPEQLRENEIQNELLLDNAATCSQHPALEEPTVRECIVLNIVNPLRVAYAWAADEMDAYKDAAEKRMNERDAALEELAALRAQLAERDAEIAALKALADAMADELREPMALHSYRAAYPKEIDA